MSKEKLVLDKYEKYAPVISESLLFRNFGADEIQECIDHAYPKIIGMKKNEILTMPKNLTTIFLVLSGQFNVFQDSGMNASLVHVLTPGRCFGIAFCAEKIPCPDLLQASEKGELLRLSYQGLLAGETTRYRMLENLLAITSANLRLLAEKINHTQSHSVRVKLSVFLRDMAKHSGSLDFPMEMNRKDMADYLNITYPAMLRELSRMQKEGILVIDGDYVRICDLEALIDQGSEYNIM